MVWDDGLEGPALDIARTDERILRVIAGPGTGKTFSLMRRLARLLEEGVNPREILLVTFTRVAAQDLAKAIDELDIDGTDQIEKGTLHAFCNSILNLNQVNQLTNRTPRMLLEFEKKFLLQDLPSEEFGRMADREEMLNAFEAAWARRQDEDPGWPSSQIEQQFSIALLDWLTFHKAMIIGELIPRTLRFLKDNPQNEVLQRYSHIFIDEYQDLNRAEQSLLDELGENASMTVIGDEDQSIYETLKYANPEGISQFHQTHANTHDIPIEECRRCPSRIVSIANALIQNNINRVDRVLTHRKENLQGEINIVQWPTLVDEINGVVNHVARQIHDHVISSGEVLILSPRRHVGYLIRDGLRNRGIEAHSFFKEPLLDLNPKLDDKCLPLEVFSVLLLLENPEDAVALRCWLGYGSSSLRAKGYRKLRTYSAENDLTPLEALNSAINDQISIPYIGAILVRYRFLVQKLDLLNELDEREKIDHLFPEGASWAEPFRDLMDEKIDSDEFSISKVIAAIKQHSTQPETPMDANYVRIMSLQKSKGLSAEHVIVTNCLQGLIPSLKPGDPGRMQRELEEQRRLFYVAITRTRNTLLLTNSSTLPYNLAMMMGAQFGRNASENLVHTITSKFINDLGPIAPEIIRGQDWDV